MLKITQDQVKKLAKGTDSVFLCKVKSLLESEIPQQWQNIQPQGQFDILTEFLSEARSLHIDIEQDVYDFIKMSIINGKGFYKEELLGVDLEWLGSEFVPGKIKIQALKEVLSKRTTQDDSFGRESGLS